MPILLDRAGSPGWIAALLFVIACGLRLARFNVLDEDLDRPAWQAEYFVGVPAPAGAVLVLLPAYIGFMGVEAERPLVYASVVFTVLIAFLLVSRLPVYSGKTIRKRVSVDWVMPLIFGLVFYVLLLMTYPWQTLSASVVAYLIFLPLSARAYAQRAQLEAAKAPKRLRRCPRGEPVAGLPDIALAGCARACLHRERVRALISPPADGCPQDATHFAVRCSSRHVEPRSPWRCAAPRRSRSCRSRAAGSPRP